VGRLLGCLFCFCCCLSRPLGRALSPDSPSPSPTPTPASPDTPPPPCKTALPSLLSSHPTHHPPLAPPKKQGLTVEQRKRLTIAVELVTRPGIVMLDEPTSGAAGRPLIKGGGFPEGTLRPCTFLRGGVFRVDTSPSRLPSQGPL
jgi:hypothetical protein